MELSPDSYWLDLTWFQGRSHSKFFTLQQIILNIMHMYRRRVSDMRNKLAQDLEKEVCISIKIRMSSAIFLELWKYLLISYYVGPGDVSLRVVLLKLFLYYCCSFSILCFLQFWRNFSMNMNVHNLYWTDLLHYFSSKTY